MEKKQEFKRYLISQSETVHEALQKLDKLASDAVLFVVDAEDKLLGSITDGDMRRGFIKGFSLESPLTHFIYSSPKFIRSGENAISQIIEFRKKDIMIVPILDQNDCVINVLNLKHHTSYLPIDAVIMAGGRGERLKPLTDSLPKPLLPISDKPIIEYNLDRLKDFGIEDIWITVNYLADQIMDRFKDGAEKSINIQYVQETKSLGTAGALSLIDGLSHDTVLLMNSDLLTNINFEEFFLFFQEQKADLAVACISYQVNIPYAVVEEENFQIRGFKEKPTYTHFTNAGIYLMKREILDIIPKDERFDATDLMQKLIDSNKKVVAFPMLGYWLDIGKHEDYQKAQEDIKHIKL
ncbi:MAG: nucleotidyltransferase family protein [Aquirufa sp.]